MDSILFIGYDETAHKAVRPHLVNGAQLPDALPDNLTVIEATSQVRGLQTFIRNKNSPRDLVIFYSERLSRILIEETMQFIPYVPFTCEQYNGQQ